MPNLGNNFIWNGSVLLECRFVVDTQSALEESASRCQIRHGGHRALGSSHSVSDLKPTDAAPSGSHDTGTITTEYGGELGLD